MEKRQILEIKNVIKAQSYVECCNCGAIKVDAMELARGLHILTERYFGIDEEQKYETFQEMLWKIIEYEPVMEDDDYEKWDRENEHRFCSFLDPDNYTARMYIKYSEVLLFSVRCNYCIAMPAKLKSVLQLEPGMIAAV